MKLVRYITSCKKKVNPFKFPWLHSQNCVAVFHLITPPPRVQKKKYDPNWLRVLEKKKQLLSNNLINCLPINIYWLWGIGWDSNEKNNNTSIKISWRSFSQSKISTVKKKRVNLTAVKYQQSKLSGYLLNSFLLSNKSEKKYFFLMKFFKEWWVEFLLFQQNRQKLITKLRKSSVTQITKLLVCPALLFFPVLD